MRAYSKFSHPTPLITLNVVFQRTKDELRRALTMAGGHGSHPPTTKDVDDLFTLFSCRTKAGVVGGGRVEAATVLRGLRGELGPRREAVVREVFSSLLRLADESIIISGGGGRGKGKSKGKDRGAKNGERRGAVRQTVDAIPLEELRNACNKAGGWNAGLLIGRSTSTTSIRGAVSCCDDRGRAVLREGGGSSGLGADVGCIRPLLAGRKQIGGKVGRRTAAEKGVTVEQFLEYYT